MLRVEFKFLKRRCTVWRHTTTVAARETILHAQSLVWPRLKELQPFNLYLPLFQGPKSNWTIDWKDFFIDRRGLFFHYFYIN